MRMVIAANAEEALAGFRNGDRIDVDVHKSVDGDGVLALAANARTGSPAGVHLDILMRRRKFGRDAGPYLFHVGIRCPAGHRQEIIDWYDREHFAALMRSALWHGGVLCEEKVATGAQLHALYSLESAAALDAPERKASRATEWFIRLSRHEWFDKGFSRKLYRRQAGDTPLHHDQSPVESSKEKTG